MDSDAGPLCATWFDPQGRLRLPIGARVWFALYLKGPSFSPPRSGPCRARLPWRVRLWVGPPLALPSRGAGGPLCLFLPPPFFLCFSCLVRIIRGLGVFELKSELAGAGLAQGSISTSAQASLFETAFRSTNEKAHFAQLPLLTPPSLGTNKFPSVVAERTEIRSLVDDGGNATTDCPNGTGTRNAENRNGGQQSCTCHPPPEYGGSCSGGGSTDRGDRSTHCSIIGWQERGHLWRQTACID